MTPEQDQAVTASDPYPAVRLLLARKRWITNGGAAAFGVLTLWLAYRWALPELYLIGPLLAVALHFVLRVAIEVVGLVAETLMPQ